MQKIPTLFKRDDTTRKVVDEFWEPDWAVTLRGARVTEKVDGTNVRLTVRSGELVRVEGRKNPQKPQKERGITEPWYREAWLFGGDEPSSGDKHIVDAARNTDLTGVPDGEWSGEAVGPAIQGNPLELEQREVILFSLATVRVPRLGFAEHHQMPPDFAVLREWLASAESLVSPGHPIEGLVWWAWDGDGRDYPVAKIKAKDFA